MLQKNSIFVREMAARFSKLRRSLLSDVQRVQEGCQEAQKVKKKKKKAHGTREGGAGNLLHGSARYVTSVWLRKLNHFS